MKRSILAFVLFVSFILLAVPAINIYFAPSREAIRMEKSFLFNVDFVSRWTAALLYPLGISTDPKKVIVGKDDWLYLGDGYQTTVSDDRRVATEADRVLGRQIGAATKAWDSYLKAHGVQVFSIMIGPNKSSIYPENMPSWARPISHNPVDALLQEAGSDIFIDLRPPLLKAKKILNEDLYFKTDTHWNALGAGIAFRHFAEQLGKADPNIRWPSEKFYDLIGNTKRKGGDLANFLRLSSSFSDPEPRMYSGVLPVQTSQVDYLTGVILRTGGNPGVDAPSKPLLVRSEGALNKKKVLWLRDSFGSALSPLMASTFSDVLHLHWSQAIKPGGNFAQLVKEFKPDYVFVTVVERAARSAEFSYYPPPVLLAMNDDFKIASDTEVVSMNHLKPSADGADFNIVGNDAYFDVSLNKPISAVDGQYLGLDLICSDGSLSVPLQLYWIDESGTSYSQANSVSLQLPVGATLIDLRTVYKWPAEVVIKRLRVDLEQTKSCSRLKLKNPKFLTR